MASHQLIEAHLRVLAGRLPAEVVDELADGLIETWQRHLATGLPPTEAARAAIAEFGTAEQITAAFVTQSPGRRHARFLLVTGPLVGAAWGASLLIGRAWTWPVPAPAEAAFGLVLVVVVALLVASATSRRSYRRARLGRSAGLGLLALDTGMLAAVALAAPALVWPMVVAIPVSLARIMLTLRALPAARAG
jgi:hypothetical protein